MHIAVRQVLSTTLRAPYGDLFLGREERWVSGNALLPRRSSPAPTAGTALECVVHILSSTESNSKSGQENRGKTEAQGAYL